MRGEPAGGPLATPPPRVSTAAAGAFLERAYGLSGELTSLGSERDQNFHVRTPAGEGYMLRIANAREDPGVVDLRIAALRHVAACDETLPVQRVVGTLAGDDRGELCDEGGRRHIAHLVTYLDGVLLEDVPAPWGGFRDMGGLQARLCRALRGFFHPAADHHLFWDIKRAAGLRGWLDDVADPAQRALAARALERFEARALSRLPRLRAQVIHDDVTPDNVLVARGQPERVVGILDFGDMVHAPLIDDLAVSVADLTAAEPDPLAAGLELVAGFHTVTPIEPEELAILPELVMARLAADLVIAAWRGRRGLDNRDPGDGDAGRTAARLERLLAADPQDLGRRLEAACARHGYRGPRFPSMEALVQHRRARLGPAYELSYDRPLHLVRGEGCWLDDAEGRRYLDAYNNVAHVGHCHPRVVEALARQAATLNTNTRYLHEHILEYADRICARMPAGLDVCMLVCTGSEANDLAWRLAQAWNGGTGALVTENAYHGNTSVITRISPEDWGAMPAPEHVATIPAPDGYRGPYSGPDAATRYAARAGEALAALRSRGHAPAALYLDALFTSEGVFVPPPGCLEALAGAIEDTGVLFVADEVQAGFARTGDHFWSFLFGDVTPDIVTLGKPIANGHPVGAVVTRREIAERFAEGPGYFNTFGGNPVSCAAALAVLDVIEEEGLQARAKAVGGYLAQGLRRLATRHPSIGDVRGAGLHLGVDLIEAGTANTPDPGLARRVVNRMREDGVLVGITGVADNVLKIRPPMVFDEAAADLLCDTLDAALQASGRAPG